MAVDREASSEPPNFQTTRSGQSITLSILTAAKTEGYSVTLDYPTIQIGSKRCLILGINHLVY